MSRPKKTSKKQRKYGLKLDVPKKEDYVFGGITKVPMDIIMPDGQWDEFLPLPEYQAFNLVESQGCVSFGSLNCIEILIKKKYNE